MKKTILITGGCGFVGSNLAISFKKFNPEMHVIAMDNLKRRGSELNIQRLKNVGVEFIHGDIRKAEDLSSVPAAEIMIECSAEPSVLAGFSESPEYLINTNLVGAFNCFEYARRHSTTVLFLSSSRVYPHKMLNSLIYSEGPKRYYWDTNQNLDDLSNFQGITEKFPLNGPRSMYGATKLCAEYLLQEYADMYSVKYIVNRCGVIAGPWQFGKADQGVFTLWMLNHYFKRPLQYIGFGGKGKQVRDLLHINDLFELINLQLSKIDLINKFTYNVGGGFDCSLSLIEATELAQQITGNVIPINPNPVERPADLRIYITDNNKVNLDLGWFPKITPEMILGDIFSWIRENETLICKI